jgi:phage shock protein PspC (stress-responsive transcriptional regulator)
MYRNPENSILAGVCGGMGAYMNSDPVWFRILFIVFAMMGGLGIFVYLALWIALPTASTDTQKKEMYGGLHNLAQPQQWDKHQGSSVGHAFNEVFKAFGKVFYIIVRVFLILIGTSLVITGFLALLTFVMVFIFKYPGVISTDVTGINLSYFPDFLNYMVSQQMVPWIKTLILLVVSLPLLALTYVGIRLIFWFRARDGFIWLAGLILWVISATALSIILYTEGIGFAETGKISSQEYFSVATDTLYIRSAIKLSDIKIDKEISIPGENDDVFYISDDKKEIYFHTNLNFSRDEGTRASVEIRKRSSGRSRLDAIKKSERLLYNYNISGKTIYLDEFFTIPSDRKWSFDNVLVSVMAPEGTIIYMDTTVENLFHSKGDDDYVPDPKSRYWIMTDNGLSYIEPDKLNK